MNMKEKFKSFLKARRLKFTPERKMILGEVFSFHDHFDVDQLHGKLHREGKHLSRATIYRTLPLLVQSDLIRETFRSRSRISYEHIFGHDHHDHLLCMRCGRVIEFKEDKIERLQETICKRYGFKAIEHRMGIRGYCTKCLRKQ